MRSKLFGIIFFGMFIISCKLQDVKTLESGDRTIDGQQNYRVMFYNTENLQHPSDDSLHSDEEYTPDGIRHWTDYRYQQKLNHIYKVIMAVGDGTLPVIVGLCEVENRTCVQDLIHRTPLFKYRYSFSHFESPDPRGIDVAMLYIPEQFGMISEKAVPIHFPPEISNSATRDILYVKGLLFRKDTLHVFINHWPSKFSGAKESESLRFFVAQVLRRQCDSILNADNKAKILLMGDFNDEPEDYSIANGLKAFNTWTDVKYESLYNLSYHLQSQHKLWTHKFQDHSGIIDQIIVSGSLLKSSGGLYTTVHHSSIYSSDFLLMDDDVYFGKKTFRTYSGMYYLGGFSDHLPVYLDLMIPE